jgi:uncharacterized membrane protein
MPPLHPAIVHFPIALVTISFIADLLGSLLNKTALRVTAFWSLAAAFIFGIVTVITGYWDMTRDTLGETDRYVDFHMDTGLLLLAAVVVMFVWRWFTYARRQQVVTKFYLVVAFIVFCLTIFQGWYGGEMVYSQGAGVAAAEKGTEKPEAGKKRLDAVTPAGD